MPQKNSNCIPAEQIKPATSGDSNGTSGGGSDPNKQTSGGGDGASGGGSNGASGGGSEGTSGGGYN